MVLDLLLSFVKVDGFFFFCKIIVENHINTRELQRERERDKERRGCGMRSKIKQEGCFIYI